MSKTNENANDQQPLDRLSLSELMGPVGSDLLIGSIVVK